MFNRLKEFFGFTKKELNGLLVFCLLLLLVVLSPLLSSLFKKQEEYPSARLRQEIETFRDSEEKTAANRTYNYGGMPGSRYASEKRNNAPGLRSRPVYFRFNPNGLPAAQWMKLGLSAAQARVIINYQAKGGSFRKKEDLKRIYSLSESDYQRLEPYIDIPENRASAASRAWGSKRPFAAKTAPVLVELNSADSATLETVRGIGPVLASRIVRYRDRLGGFLQKDQIREVYGVDSARYMQLEAQITVDPASVIRIPVNTVSFEGLKKFPYLSYKQMNAIIQYRKQHGPYSGPADLRKIAILNEEILRKIAPYLIFQ